MKKSARMGIIVILMVLSIVAVLVPIWRLAKGERISILANSYIDLPVTINIGRFDSLIIAKDEEAISTIPDTDIILNNRNGFIKKKKLYLLIDKTSTISYKQLRVAINGKIVELNDDNLESDEKNYYFYLSDISIAAYKREKIKIKMWLSEEAISIEDNASLITNFIVK